MTLSPRELAAQKIQLQKEQERLFKDLLGVLDALDHACDHWQNAEQAYQPQPIPIRTSASLSKPSMRQRFGQWCTHLQTYFGKQPHDSQTAFAQGSPTDSMVEVVGSARDGVEMIRRSLLEVLHQRQVVPLEALGKPFDPERMYALGRQESDSVAANTIVREVVRGYLWQDRILREAQVIVSTQSTDDP
ncbi:MAG: nucleotide exchange factor GrpE [Acaryochloridaceae cyanobacterium RU_4_10]|nr:nucleotide exchange factor GrpE [Acaryochloridaceae cyanobacterium RU_4_10]